MAEIEDIDTTKAASPRRLFAWLLFTIIRPVRTIKEIVLADRAVWLLPMLLLSILVILNALTAGPLRQQAALANGVETPQNFEYLTPEQQEQYMQAQQSKNGPAATILFPALGSLAGVWVSWVLLGSILHLTLTMLGSRSSNTTAYNLTAWASLPFSIRQIVQILGMLSTHQLITSPGLSGFIAADAGGVLLYIKIMLRLVDLYLFWQMFLLIVGTSATSGLPRAKSISGVLISILLILLLSALPGFLIAQFSSLNVTQPFIFF